MCVNITKIKNNVWQINENGLDCMYLIKGEKQSAVIDTGTGISDFKHLIETIINQPYVVILTHAHVDHAGGCGQFSEVYIHEKDEQEANGITLEDRYNYIKNMENTGSIEKNSVDIAEIIRNNNKPHFRYIKDRDEIDLGDKKLVIYEMPGHTAGSICILDEKDRILFSGDNVNDIELICAPAEDRKELLRKWYLLGCNIFSMKDKFDICGGGHGMIEINKAMDTLLCGKKILEGKVDAKKRKIHFFNGMFYQYKDIFLYNGSLNELY